MKEIWIYGSHHRQYVHFIYKVAEGGNVSRGLYDLWLVEGLTKGESCAIDAPRLRRTEGFRALLMDVHLRPFISIRGRTPHSSHYMPTRLVVSHDRA